MNVLKLLPLFLRAPVYVLPFPNLNRAGLQAWRIKSKLRELKKNEQSVLPEQVRKAINTLEKEGICLIRDFLTESEFKELENAIERLKRSASIRHELGKEGGNIEWTHGNFPIDDAFKIINTKFRMNSALHQIVENYTNRRILFYPEVIYQKLAAPVGVVDKNDVQTVLHADRHYRTVKMFFAVSDHTVESGAFWYSPGSHVMDEMRIKFEKEFSYRAALEKVGRRDAIDSRLLENGRSVIHPELTQRFPPRQICAEKNTLIIADVSGFHKRGLIAEGSSRETIRMIYHYVHTPAWIQKLFNLLKRSPSRYLN